MSWPEQIHEATSWRSVHAVGPAMSQARYGMPSGPGALFLTLSRYRWMSLEEGGWKLVKLISEQNLAATASARGTSMSLVVENVGFHEEARASIIMC
eukprot:5150094-Heterocapsa_arctica.AAC.1